jgi:hypothetical protein
MARFLGTDETGYARGAFAARVATIGRRSDACDKGCCVLFVVAVAAYVGLTGYFVANANVKADLSNYSEVISEVQIACLTSNGRLLTHEPNDVFRILAKFPAVPVVLILIAVALSMLVLLALYRIPQTLTWLSVVLNVACYLFLGVSIILAAQDGHTSPTMGYMFLALGAGTLVLAFVTRNKIIMAGRHLKTASLALSKNTSIFPAALILQVLAVAAVLLFWLANDAAARNVSADDYLCEIRTGARSSASFFLFMVGQGRAAGAMLRRGLI